MFGYFGGGGGGGGGGATIPSTTNLIKGDGAGNGADSLVSISGPTVTRVKTVRDAADTVLELGGSYTPTGTWTSLTMVTPALGTPASGTLTNCTFPTLNQNTTGSAASLSVSGQTGLVTVTGITSTNRAKTVRDAADTLLELGGSYTPTGTWTNMALVTPTAAAYNNIVGSDVTVAGVAPAVAGTSTAGNNATVSGSNATAGNVTASAANGGNLTLQAGNAARLTSGNGNGGNVNISAGNSVGAGTAGNINLQINGVSKWQLGSSGNWIAATDATFDIGATVTTLRPRDISLSRNLQLGGCICNTVVPQTIASNATIAPTANISFVSGTTQITTITAPTGVTTTGGQVTLIPTGLWSTGTSGNIALASTAVVSKALTLYYDPTGSKWYPSY